MGFFICGSAGKVLSVEKKILRQENVFSMLFCHIYIYYFLCYCPPFLLSYCILKYKYFFRFTCTVQPTFLYCSYFLLQSFKMQNRIGYKIKNRSVFCQPFLGIGPYILPLRRITLTSLTRLASGVTPQKFLRWPLRPSQELHRCSEPRSTVYCARGGQYTLANRSDNQSLWRKFAASYISQISNTKQISLDTKNALPVFILVLRVDEAERLPTWLPPPPVYAALLNTNTALGSQTGVIKTSKGQKQMHQPQLKQRRFEKSVWRSCVLFVDKNEVSPDARQRFVLFFVALHTVVSDYLESRHGEVLHGRLLHDSQGLALIRFLLFLPVMFLVIILLRGQ